MENRAFVVVLDACGAGELPDAADYGDAGANTLGHLAQASGGLDLPTFERLGLGSILPLAGVPPAAQPVLHGRLHPLGPGKDTITGHWELMGVVTPEPLRTYPEGFPPEILDALHDATGRAILCNRPYNGVAAIEDYGERHLQTGDLIVYTSADSVLQIAAHVDEVPPAELYSACAAAREIMRGEHTVGRVIARPFRGEPGAFQRTTGRRDLAISPPGNSYLEQLQAAGVPVHSVGKVGQVFAGVGVDESHAGATNATAIATTTGLMDELDSGFVFANFVETDQVFGHRGDVPGFHRALREIDTAVDGWLERLDPERDLLVLTADHGCDPTTPGSDHTREHAPLLAAFAGHGGRRHDGPLADVGASVLVWLAGRDAPGLPGESFVR
ncbi:MAG TPA: phosphopentomutase [Solirubrobacteraceae bacterium]|nr:phosphopentomutase [Solirubrobacteraceae bacterium]